ncbi:MULTISPECIES: hypothetical protein [unclassified Streptomyces]|uniref:hypothetical protein n=1 Tax=unclassified Streptomyces TaxID=2593676 RepID=UPI000DAE5997|nr:MULTISPECIES: hypothetical protein [unclassified Streptomyces]PZT73777.1 hypothetical protein DNK55_16280 [Streptomyces sp. AC1-42T]PZT83227.1 hypothetical protein DNK56_15145 [Streptomyces sp. AC1-42W]
MLAPPATHEELARQVITPVLARWSCLLNCDDVRPSAKNMVRVALATVLHKYGFHDEDVTAQAIRAVDDLNRDVVLSDAFERQSEDIKKFLSTAPTPLARKPITPRSLTFLRAGDVLSIEFGGRFHAAYVWKIWGCNEEPEIEFYEGTFSQPPTMADLSGREAARPAARARFRVTGLTYLPDPAHQVRAVAAAHVDGPRGGEPIPGRGLHTVTDVMALQQDMVNLFGPVAV